MATKKINITVPDKHLLEGVVHGSVWRQGAFYWQPTAFVVESPKLNQLIIEESVQTLSLRRFMRNPTLSQIYVVAGNPDDSKAKLFAAYLAAIHKNYLGHHADIYWEPIFGGFDNPLMKKDIAPSMLILSNLAENSTNMKFEKAKDLLERFPNIPRVVVVAGEDPVSFAATKLHSPVHSLAYFVANITKTAQEIL